MTESITKGLMNDDVTKVFGSKYSEIYCKFLEETLTSIGVTKENIEEWVMVSDNDLTDRVVPDVHVYRNKEYQGTVITLVSSIDNELKFSVSLKILEKGTLCKTL